MKNENENKGVLKMPATVQKWGNSLGIRIPKKVAEEFGIVNGSQMEIIVKEGQIILEPAKIELTLEELMAQITPENHHEEIDFGKPEGNELL